MKAPARRLLTAALPLAFVVLVAQPALADSWSSDGTDAYATGCAASAWNVYTSWTGTGWLRLYYSNGCATAWAEFTCASSGGCTFFTLWAKRTQDGKSAPVWISWPNVVPNGATIHSPQLFDGLSYSTRACYQGYWGAPLTCTWPY